MSHTEEFTLDHFILTNRIGTKHQAKIRKDFDRMVSGEVEPFAPDQVPGYLHDVFLRMARQARYKAVNANQKFNAEKTYLP